MAEFIEIDLWHQYGASGGFRGPGGTRLYLAHYDSVLWFVMSSSSAPRPAPLPASDRETSTPLAVGAKISIRGTIISRGDVYLNGEVEGKVEAINATVTVGPNAKVIANLDAKKVIVVGNVDGNIKASEVVEVQKTGSITGDLTTARIAIEDGAYIKGSVSMVRQ